MNFKGYIFQLIRFVVKSNGAIEKRATTHVNKPGSCHKYQKPQAPTPQAPIRNRQTRKVANAKGPYRNTNLT